MQIDPLQPLGYALDRRRITAQGLQVTLAGIGVIDHCRQRLIDFVGSPGSQLTQGHQPRCMGHFILVMALLGFAQFAFAHIPGHQ